MTPSDLDMLGKTDRELARHRDAEVKSRSAFERRWQLLWEFDGDTELACRLYDAIAGSRLANARQIVIDWVEDSHFLALTDCPLAYLKMEASRLGIRDVTKMLSGDDDDWIDEYQRSIEALERGEAAPDEIPVGWH